MDDSQSSDLFSLTNTHEISAINEDTYNILIAKIKAVHLRVDEKTLIHPEEFISTLEDCQACVYQSLDIIISSLEDSSLQIVQLCSYIEDTICILHILSNLIKNVVETMALTCSTMKNFPTTTGNIILSVFRHCKDSECIYGNSLSVVEKQLKDLFRNCHELQLTYLMALEKHLVFDLSESDEQDILLATLDINLRVTEIVQSLDVKTTAEQWKAYTMICEKYANFLMDKDVYNTSTKLLALTIKNNIMMALEANEDDKIVLRSLKVACFSLKILLRMCNIFKCSFNNNYGHVVDLLLYICLCNGPNYEVTANKSPQFSKLIETILSTPIYSLIEHLITEDRFLKEVYSRKICNLKDYSLLGYILLTISIMNVLVKTHLQSDNEFEIISCVFSFLPYCHKWFNIGLKYKYTSEEGEIQCGLYEHLLLNMTALTTTLSYEQYQKLENYLYESILGTDCYSALFASNLWTLVCSMGNSELHLNTMLGLLRVYQKLEFQKSFLTSPQRIYLTCTIEKLFSMLQRSEKLQIYNKFNIQNVRNIDIWCALKIRNLPDNVQMSATEWIVEELISNFNRGVNEIESYDMDHLIKYINLTSTCSFLESDPRIEEVLVTGWLKACPACQKVLQKRNLSSDCLVYFRYIESLTHLTDHYVEKIEEVTNLFKVIQVISNIMLIGNIDIIILLFELFSKICTILLDVQNDSTTEYIISNTLKGLLDMNDEIKLFIFDSIASDDNISKLSNYFESYWKNYVDFKKQYDDDIEWQKRLEATALYEHTHKCIEINEEEIKRTKSDCHFDLGDIDSLFDESNEQPAKRAKFDIDVEKLVEKLEADASQLCQIKDNILSELNKDRIISVCENLKNIVS